MKLRADLSKRALVLPSQMKWVPSPEVGVERIMLDRDGDEVARATSLVRFDKNSSFAPHTHELGEEMLILEGVFSDEDGDFAKGSYVRNPPGSTHRPFSKPGCLLFVKLRQFDPTDQARKLLHFSQLHWEQEIFPGVSRMNLHQFGPESIYLIRLSPKAIWPTHSLPAGEEILVVEGSFEDELGHYPTRSWLRTPAGSEHQISSQEGCVLYVKTGHLPPVATGHHGGWPYADE
jgi:anti-sigma factor ChrR (cupin superfamily)